MKITDIFETYVSPMSEIERTTLNKQRKEFMEQKINFPFGAIYSFILTKDLKQTRTYAIAANGKMFKIKNLVERKGIYFGDITSEEINIQGITKISLIAKSIKIGDEISSPIQLDALPNGSVIETIIPELLRQDPSTEYTKINKQWKGSESSKKVPSRAFDSVMREYKIIWVK